MRAALERLEQPATMADVERVFLERALSLAKPAAVFEPETKERRIMVFLIGNERVALPLGVVSELISTHLIAPVPGAPSEIAGVMQLRGEILPVFDLGRVLGIASEGAGGIVVVALHRQRHVALRVDGVEDIRSPGDELVEGTSEDPRIAAVTGDLTRIVNLDEALGGHAGD
jgi:purine-binding chemotaxis protein CheW